MNENLIKERCEIIEQILNLYISVMKEISNTMEKWLQTRAKELGIEEVDSHD